MTEKQYAAILDAIDKAKQELLLKLTEIMNEPNDEEESNTPNTPNTHKRSESDAAKK